METLGKRQPGNDWEMSPNRARSKYDWDTEGKCFPILFGNRWSVADEGPTPADELYNACRCSSPTKFPLTDGRRSLLHTLSPSSLLPSRILSKQRPAPTTSANSAMKPVALRLNPIAKVNNTFQRPRRLTLGGITHRHNLTDCLSRRSVGNATQAYTGGISRRHSHPTASSVVYRESHTRIYKAESTISIPYISATQAYTRRNHTSPLHSHTGLHWQNLTSPFSSDCLIDGLLGMPYKDLLGGIIHRHTSRLYKDLLGGINHRHTSYQCHIGSHFLWQNHTSPLLLHSHTGSLSLWRNQPSPGSLPTTYIGDSVGHQSPAMAICVAPSLTGSPRVSPTASLDGSVGGFGRSINNSISRSRNPQNAASPSLHTSSPGHPNSSAHQATPPTSNNYPTPCLSIAPQIGSITVLSSLASPELI
eukprot:Gb_08177 [translate_table: standard]